MRSARQMVEDGLPWFSTALAAASAAVPGAQFFTEGAPPLFPLSAALVSLIGAFIVLFVLWPSRRRTVRRRVVLSTFIAGLVFLMAYWVVLPDWTASPPDEQAGPRWQVGFGHASWSLTELGRSRLDETPGATNTDLLLQVAGFQDGGPDRIWKKSTINAAGTILVVLYMSGFAAWTTSFALLGRRYFSTRSSRPADDKAEKKDDAPLLSVEVTLNRKKKARRWIGAARR